MFVSGVVATTLYLSWRRGGAPSPLGLPDWAESLVLGVLWVLLLTSLGAFRKAPPEELPQTLDSADWHLDTVRELGCPDQRALRVGAQIVGWLALRGLLAGEARASTSEALEGFRERRISALDLYELWGGKILSTDPDPEMAPFLAQYLASSGDYSTDLESAYGKDVFVADEDWQRFEAICRLIDRRVEAWRERTQR